MELPLRSTRHLVPSSQDNPPNIHIHHHHHHPHKLNNLKDLSKTEGRTKSGFAQKKQCRYTEDPDSIDVIRDEASFLKFKPCTKSMGRNQVRI